MGESCSRQVVVKVFVLTLPAVGQSVKEGEAVIVVFVFTFLLQWSKEGVEGYITCYERDVGGAAQGKLL